jgi:hypothetical protein
MGSAQLHFEAGLSDFIVAQKWKIILMQRNGNA